MGHGFQRHFDLLFDPLCDPDARCDQKGSRQNLAGLE
jgi:hypothetical protein